MPSINNILKKLGQAITGKPIISNHVDDIISEIAPLEVTDMTKLTTEQINNLVCGSKIIKKTGKQRHLYQVTYKEDKVGICITYMDASTVETHSYDYSNGNWVYNSKDTASLTA